MSFYHSKVFNRKFFLGYTGDKCDMCAAMYFNDGNTTPPTCMRKYHTSNLCAYTDRFIGMNG